MVDPPHLVPPTQLDSLISSNHNALHKNELSGNQQLLGNRNRLRTRETRQHVHAGLSAKKTRTPCNNALHVF